MAGSDDQPDAIFTKFGKAREFMLVQDDLNHTLEDAHKMAISIIAHEGGKFSALANMKTVSGIDVLDDLPGLIASVSRGGGVAQPSSVADTMEDDELCQIATVFLTLDYTIKHIASLLKCMIRQ